MTVDFASSVRANLSAPEVERRSLGYPNEAEALALSPTRPAVLAQDALEPILVAHARSYPSAELRFNTELCELHPTDDGVRATIVDRATGERTEVCARYVIAADGASSPIRRRLGIATQGVERIGEYFSILFQANMESVVGRNLCGLYMLQGLGGPAPSVALPTSRDGRRWVLATPWRGDAQPPSALGPEDLVALVRRAAGRSDLDVTVLGHQLIGIGAEVAERFRDGNVFLVGDAAHRTAPTGGTGMNTAIHSAHNLAWKLAAVWSGIADASLLDTYEPERRPSGERNLLRSRGQLQGVSGVAADLGVVYASNAIVAENGVERPSVIEPTTTPVCVGARAPHVWLDADGLCLSTLDLFDHGMTLLTGVDGTAWRSAVRSVSQSLGVPLGVVTIGGAELVDLSGSWLTSYGIDKDGAVLVRPDGHIAWRSAGAAADPAATIGEVVSRVLGLGNDDHHTGTFHVGEDRRCA
jgi:putative polyketide hydroxylase